MAPTRTVKSSVKGAKSSSKPSALGAKTKSRVSKKPKAPPPKQQKTKPAQGPAKKKRRVYTDKELGIPKLNMITPVGVDLPKGKKKGKVFVDDQVHLPAAFGSWRGFRADTLGLSGKHDDDSCHCKCEQRGPD